MEDDSQTMKSCADVVAVLKDCSKQNDLQSVTMIHASVFRSRLFAQSHTIARTLVSAYAKCGAFSKSKQLLDELPTRDAVCWSTLIAGYVHHGHDEEALQCLDLMQQDGHTPNAITFASILKACGNTGAADKGKQIHDEIIRQGLLEKDVVLGNALVDMYVRHGALSKAQFVLKGLPARDVISWSTLISGYCQQGYGEEALGCFDLMQCEGHTPDAVTFASILKACSNMGAVYKGKEVHNEILRYGLLQKDAMLGNALVDMYVKCGDLAKAQQVLRELPVRNVITWNTLITGLSQGGKGQEALNCYKQMQSNAIFPDRVTFIGALTACASIGAIGKSKEIHKEILRQGLLGKDIALGTALVDMYAKCGALAKARKVLDELPVQNVVSWSTLIAGYAQKGEADEALKCLDQMQREGHLPNSFTFFYILKVCARTGATGKGKQIHDDIIKQRLLEKSIILGTALVDMYAKCGAFKRARQLVEQLHFRDIVAWNVIIARYAQQGHTGEVLNCFDLMKNVGITPDASTFAGVLTACSHSGLLDENQIHLAN